ncbi:MAG: hypothetical protein KDC07_06445 [Chitinophagaceae bacterium]|nr:hypothetical protein [Chitinophagaceae bacterium]MCB9047272.1 hypothetical protein [Chitinophagales bacterium]
MRKIIIIPFLCTIMSGVSAQVIDVEETEKKINNVVRGVNVLCNAVEPVIVGEDTNKIATSGTYKRYIDQYFTYLSYSRGTLPTGTSASLVLADKETQLNLNISRKVEGNRGGILLMTSGVSAKLDNNVSQLFNGNVPQSGTTFFGNFAFLPKNGRLSRSKKGQIIYVTDYFDEHGNHTSPLEIMHKKRAVLKEAYCNKYQAEFVSKYTAILDRWEELNGMNLEALNSVEVIAVLKEKEALEKTLRDAGLLDKSAEKIANEVIKKYTNELYDLEIEDASWLSVSFFWWSGGITYTREAYDTYNSNAPLSKRFSTQDFDALGLNIAANWFKEKFEKQGLIQSYYANIGYAPKRTNSIAGLKSQEILRSINNSPGNDTMYLIQSSKKAKNVTNVNYETNIKHVFSGTYTAMFGENKSSGLNFSAQLIVSPISKPVYNTHIGYLVRLLNNQHDPEDKKSKARINFEVFLELPDMTDVAKTNNTIWENGIIGINTSVPFNKIFFK